MQFQISCIAGTVSALTPGIVKSPRITRSPIVVVMALIGSLIGTGVVPVFANQIHPVCAAKAHDCGKAARITRCCCGDQGDASNQRGTVESRVRLDANLTPAPGVSAMTGSADPCPMTVGAYASPPRACPLDLPTRFVSLLI